MNDPEMKLSTVKLMTGSKNKMQDLCRSKKKELGTGQSKFYGQKSSTTRFAF